VLFLWPRCQGNLGSNLIKRNLRKLGARRRRRRMARRRNLQRREEKVKIPSMIVSMRWRTS